MTRLNDIQAAAEGGVADGTLDWRQLDVLGAILLAEGMQTAGHPGSCGQWPATSVDVAHQLPGLSHGPTVPSQLLVSNK